MDLTVEVGGLKLNNPVILASGPLGYSIKSLKRFADAGFGAVTSKTLTPTPWKGNPPPRIISVKPHYLLNSDGLRNPGFESFSKQMREWKFKNVPLIVSITAGTLEEWIEGAKLMEESGADAIQLNTSCSHIPDETHWGIYWSRDSDRFIKLVQNIKRKVKIPIWTKIKDAMLAERSGADANVVTGLYSGLLLDLRSGKPKIGMPNHWATVSGPPAKPLGLLNVAISAKKVRIPLIGSGGVMTGLDVVEYLMVGASAVELYTLAMWGGPNIIQKILNQLKEFMKQQNYSSVRDFQGKTLEYI
jgi:dihydroorotate dehydrogenase (NAD+) catalytic subunit